MRTSILDHGYLELVESWGSDERIIEAARMSTNKGFQGWGPIHNGCELDGDCVALSQPCERGCETRPGDERLLAYLWTNKHATPFEMAGLVIEVQAPIFVFREWHRHRTQSYNELSARYTPLPDVNYVPSLERAMIGVGGPNRQAGTVAGAEALTEVAAHEWLTDLEALYDTIEAHYQQGLRIGIPKELARCPIPVGRYSRMRASANLRNWLAFLTLRTAPNAQWEIRQYANAVAEIVKQRYPRTYALFIGEATHDPTNLERRTASVRLPSRFVEPSV